MSELKTWPLLGEEVLLNSKVFDVMSRRCLSPKDGKEKKFMAIKAPEWANTLALTPKNEVILVRQFRYGSREFSLELPGGAVDKGQSPEEAAKRELTEETGFVGQNFRHLCSLRPNPALFDNWIHTYVADNAVKSGQTHFDENEAIEDILIPVGDLAKMVLEGQIDHALMVAAISLYLVQSGLKK
ncbi:MAG: NUDIX hydrolase [Deltaproteobacteria bacterium]|jgi:8-oxo-dGTP pyrophosphatase MutT (NUDIX family)|nr:NUDIX hydrolase [Deltaproteobacteria bacterium]